MKPIPPAIPGGTRKPAMCDVTIGTIGQPEPLTGRSHQDGRSAAWKIRKRPDLSTRAAEVTRIRRAACAIDPTAICSLAPRSCRRDAVVLFQIIGPSCLCVSESERR